LIDIIIFALPADKASADRIADAIKERGITESNRFRLLSVHPMDAGWQEAARMAESCPSVAFCWSEATQAEDATVYRSLAKKVFEAGHAISVELDEGTRPETLTGCTTYPLYGWRADPNWFLRPFFGKELLYQIAAAAQEKAIGRDPPPPKAVAALAWKQFPTKLVGLGALASFAVTVLSIYRDPDFAKIRDPQAEAAFETAKASKSCDALRKFAVDHNGSAWSSQASELLATCKERPVTQMQKDKVTLDFFVDDTIDGIAPVKSDVDARRVSLKTAESKARQMCEDHAQMTGGKMLAASIDRVRQDCRSNGLGIVCQTAARAICAIDQPVAGYQESMGGK
jgi:hypothetical protein